MPKRPPRQRHGRDRRTEMRPLRSCPPRQGQATRRKNKNVPFMRGAYHANQASLSLGLDGDILSSRGRIMNLWTKLYAAKRRAIDRALLASMEREIANEEKLRASPEWSKLQKAHHRGQEMIDHPEAAAEAICGDVNRIKRAESERARIARAFGRPL